MTEPTTYSLRRYLAAKQTVDDRAVNRRVLDRLKDELAVFADDTGRVRVLEVGAGIGVSIERLLAWNILPDHVRITAVDIDPDFIAAARERLPRRLRNHGIAVGEDAIDTVDDGRLVIDDDARRIEIELRTADAFEFVERTDREWELVIGHAFLDLVDVDRTISTLRSGLVPDGLCYFPITFDGGTILEPPVDRVFDEHIERLYHRHMDESGDNGPAGDSRAGRHLIAGIRAAGGRVLAAGSSDWVVYPDDGYVEDEAYFLHHIVETIRQTLSGHEELDDERFAAWVDRRHRQVENGDLIYIAHQLDVLGRIPETS